MFPSTHWSQLAMATLNGDEAGRAALDNLCRRYRGPVEAFLRSRNLSPELAADITQEFFLELLRSRAWKRADPERGRFRGFLLGAVSRTWRDLYRREMAKKRGGGAVVSFDALLEDGFEPSPDDAAWQRHFDQEWARQILANALAALETDYSSAGKGELFGSLRGFLQPGREMPPMDDLAAELGMKPATLRSEVHRMRQALRDCLRSEISLTVNSHHEVEEEFQYLRQVMQGGE